MKNKVVLITGGSSGIGLAIGTFLSQKGYTVYGTSRNPEKNKDFSAFKLLELDVCDRQSIVSATAQLQQLEGRIDILINNAGVGITGPIEETPEEEVQKAFDTNLHGPLAMIQAVLPIMRQQGSGLIINITSIAGYMGLPYRAYYSASKGALELMTEALRMELKDFNIQCTSVAPGDFATNIAAGRYHAPVSEQSPYRDAYSNTLRLMDQHVDAGQDPVRVAEKVYRVIQTKRPKVHYRVGSPLQKFSLVLKSILPDKLYERLLINHYKL
ncbi:SDR family oxidoreductase [Zeaxanthinibacter enoshimensis]|uniref:Short-subunit dehydrogenase n=1 Tax=Zeaxanthinibacter enoshimensis TaxID=392009 RepID=A0A4R6TM16_9FLAO|nr:SDR family oxidoreductase [Zeaxanthinibacter enoshimensis]TDQ31592.1 short-subunit dehydrogenase [Zeaxanthinibacter enoshimensis]